MGLSDSVNARAVKMRPIGDIAGDPGIPGAALLSCGRHKAKIGLDFIDAANNLLSALIDNHIHWGNEQGIDARRIL